MKLVSRLMLFLTLMLAMAGEATAQSAVEGIWRPPDRDSDYDARLCGADNTQLCVKVAALRNGMTKPRYMQYLNTYIVEGAKPAGKNRWKGKMTLWGVTGDVVLTLKSANLLHVRACAYVVICEEIELKR